MGSSPTKHVEVRTDQLASNFGDASPSRLNGDTVTEASATVEADEAGWIACPRCLQLLEDPRQWPGCRHPVCRRCYAPDGECAVCGEVGRLPTELLARDDAAARRLERWRETPAAKASPTATLNGHVEGGDSEEVSDSDNSDNDKTDGEKANLSEERRKQRRRLGEVALEVDGESSAKAAPPQPPSKVSLAEAERILVNNGELLQRQLLSWRDEARRLDEFVAECHKAIDREADSLRRDQRSRRLRAQQQALEQADALHKLRLGAERLRAFASSSSSSASGMSAASSKPTQLLASTARGLQHRIESARQGALGWNVDGDVDGENGADGDERLGRLREFAAAAAADLMQAPPPASRLLPAAATATMTPSKASRRSLVGIKLRRRQPTSATPTRELAGVHVWDIAIVRHTGSLCHRTGIGGVDYESDVRYCPAGGKWRPLPNPCLYCLLPGSSRLLAVSPEGVGLGELRLSPRRPRGNLERLRCLGDRLFASEPEFVYVTDLTGHCLHVLAGFSWAMGLWPDPDRRRLLVVNGDRRCVEIFNLDSFSHDGSLCDDEFTDDLTGVCVVGNRLLVADHTAYKLHVYRADNLQPISRLHMSAPRFLDVDSSGAVYITGDQTDYHQITVLDPASGRQFSCGFEGSRFGEFRSPSGLAVDEVAGEVYVCDFDNQRVQVFAIN